jgi:hypothetical protein
MKPCSHLSFAKLLNLAAALLASALASFAAQTHTNTPASPSPARTNALPPLPEIPQSVFIIPTTPQEGKDPFFPRSTRLFTTVVVKSNQQPTAAAAVTVDLKLNGVSGTADRRLAIINNRTFETGEEGEVASKSGPVRISCKEIMDDSVRVIVNGQERILRLRPRP